MLEVVEGILAIYPSNTGNVLTDLIHYNLPKFHRLGRLLEADCLFVILGEDDDFLYLFQGLSTLIFLNQLKIVLLIWRGKSRDGSSSHNLLEKIDECLSVPVNKAARLFIE